MNHQIQGLLLFFIFLEALIFSSYTLYYCLILLVIRSQHIPVPVIMIASASKLTSLLLITLFLVYSITRIPFLNILNNLASIYSSYCLMFLDTPSNVGNTKWNHFLFFKQSVLISSSFLLCCFPPLNFLSFQVLYVIVLLIL